jgi:hypothetical protein
MSGDLFRARLGKLAPAMLVVACFGLGSVACRPVSDLNRPCTLLKKNPDGGVPIAVTEAEIKSKKSGNKDFFAKGTVECEFLFCVRDAQFTTDAGPNDPAIGYCSRECLEGQTCPSYDESLDKSANKLNCRALLLDKEVLGDAGIGNIREPFFCARGDSPDASM